MYLDCRLSEECQVVGQRTYIPGKYSASGSSVDLIGEIAKGVLPLLGSLTHHSFIKPPVAVDNIHHGQSTARRYFIAAYSDSMLCFPRPNLGCGQGTEDNQQGKFNLSPPGVAIQLTAALRSISISRTGMRNWAESS